MKFVLMATEKSILSDIPYQTVIERLAQKSKTLHKLFEPINNHYHVFLKCFIYLALVSINYNLNIQLR